MPAPDALFELVQSLTQSEKRHFKIFAKRHVIQNENHYIRLFDILDSLETYDDTTVKKRLGKSAFARNLPSGKNYLYNLILKSLRNYNSGKSAKINLQELWFDINALMEKGLLRQATKLIRKAKKLAQQYQYDIQLLEITLLERKLIRRYTSNRASEIIQDCQEESTTCIQRIQAQFGILDLYETVFLNYRNQNEAQESLGKVLEQAKILAPAQAHDQLSFESLNYYHLLQLHYANMIKDFQAANQHLKQLIALFEQNPFLIDEDQERYINHLNNYLNNCFSLGRLEEFPAVLDKMKTIKAKSFKTKGLIFNNVYYLEMLYHLVRQENKAVIRMVPEIEKGLARYGESITKSRQLTFYYNISSAFFMEKDYSQALEWINRILNEPKLEERQDIQSLARIFEIVLHYQLDNHDLVEYLIPSANRYWRKKERQQSAEYIISNSLKQALYADKKKEREIFTRLNNKLKEVKGLEEIKVWIQSKVK